VNAPMQLTVANPKRLESDCRKVTALSHPDPCVVEKVLNKLFLIFSNDTDSSLRCTRETVTTL